MCIIAFNNIWKLGFQSVMLSQEGHTQGCGLAEVRMSLGLGFESLKADFISSFLSRFYACGPRYEPSAFVPDSTPASYCLCSTIMDSNPDKLHFLEVALVTVLYYSNRKWLSQTPSTSIESVIHCLTSAVRLGSDWCPYANDGIGLSWSRCGCLNCYIHLQLPRLLS